MFKRICLKVNAENPQLPLMPSEPFEGSAATFEISGVPRAFGKRKITGVSVNVTNVSEQTAAVACVQEGGVWSCTVPSAAIGASGFVGNGVIIAANGTDETGAAVPCWILGAGDLNVRRQDGTIAPGTTRQNLHWFDERPSSPKAGDVAPNPDAQAVLELFDGETWRGFGGGGADVTGKLPLRPLPTYLHALAFDDTYPEDAAWLYSQLGPSDLGRCSAVRRGGKLWRNYDWTFDSSAEFAIKVSGNASRFASVGMASVGSRLTENEVASGVYSRYYRCLPGMTLDGINEKGVVCEINVDGGPKTGWHGDPYDHGIHILAAVRFVLDNCETAADAAQELAENVIQPDGEMNFHFMVADATSTYIVENGEAHDVTDGTKVLTNYGVFDSAQAGEGKERYALLAEGADIKSVWFTNAYQSGNDWDSDFESAAQHAEAIRQWAAQGTDKESHRGKTTSSGKAWWQTVHSAIYDFAAKTMKVAVQEEDEWFTFAVDANGITEVAWEDVKDKPSTFPPSSHTHPQSQVEGLADVLAEKRGMTDRKWYELRWSYTFSGDRAEEAAAYGFYVQWDDEQGGWCVYSPNGLASGPKGTRDSTELTWGADESWEGAVLFGVSMTARLAAAETTDTLALTSEVPALAAPSESATDAQAAKAKSTWSLVWGALTALPTGFASLYDWCLSQLAGKLDKSGGTMTGILSIEPEYDPESTDVRYPEITLKEPGSGTIVGTFGVDLIKSQVYFESAFLGERVYFPVIGGDGTLALISDILARIAPAFAAKTGTGAYAEGAMVTYYGSLYKRNSTAGADTSWIASHWDALADLSGVLSGLDKDGNATDQFATDLLGRQVSKAAIRNLGLKFDGDEGYWYLETEEA